jgi:hypothetical protein
MLSHHQHPVGTARPAPTPGARQPEPTLPPRATRAVARALAITCTAVALSGAAAVATPDSPLAPGEATARANVAHPGEATARANVAHPGEATARANVAHPGEATARANVAHPGKGAWIAQTPPQRTASLAEPAATQSPCPPTTRVVRGPSGTDCTTRTGSPDVLATIAILVVASLLVTWQAVAAYWRRSHRPVMELPQTQP